MELAEVPKVKDKPFSPAEFANHQIQGLVGTRIIPHDINIERKPLEDHPAKLAGFPAHEVRRIIDRVKLVELEIVRIAAVKALEKEALVHRRYEHDLVSRLHSPRPNSINGRMFGRMDQWFQNRELRNWAQGVQLSFGLPEQTKPEDTSVYLKHILQVSVEAQQKIVDEYVPPDRYYVNSNGTQMDVKEPDDKRDSRRTSEVVRSKGWLRRSVMQDFLFIPVPAGFHGLFEADRNGYIALRSLVEKNKTHKKSPKNTSFDRTRVYYGTSDAHVGATANSDHNKVTLVTPPRSEPMQEEVLRLLETEKLSLEKYAAALKTMNYIQQKQILTQWREKDIGENEITVLVNKAWDIYSDAVFGVTSGELDESTD